jgi:hypothetical protein
MVKNTMTMRNCRSLTPQNCTVLTMQNLHAKHLNQNYLHETPSSKGSEGIKVSAYAREKGKAA